MSIDPSGIEAVTFDVGGTIVDWYSGVVTQLERFGRECGVDADWDSLLKTWRIKGAGRALNSRRENLPNGNLDGVHRQVLDEILDEFGIESFSKGDREEITHFWHQVPAWPDAAVGLRHLREQYVVSTLTVLSLPMVVSVSRNESLSWDCVICCEMLDRYKFYPTAYTQTAELLDHDPDEILHVAAHELDLQAASDAGLNTAFIERPEEWGMKSDTDEVEALRKEFEGKFEQWTTQLDDFTPDVVASDIEDLASQIEA